MLLSVISIAIISSVMTTFILLTSLYRQDIKFLKEIKLQNLENNINPSVSAAIWQFDENLINSHINGLMGDEDIIFGQLEVYLWGSENYKTFEFGDEDTPDVELVEWDVTRLNRHGVEQKLGHFKLGVSLKRALHELMSRIVVLSFVIIPLITAISGGVFFLTYYFVTRHLTYIARYVENLKFDVRSSPLQLNKKLLLGKKDELDLVTESINVVYSQLMDEKELFVKETEERLRAEAANEAKSKFLASMSHELRTPLNSVIGFSDLMKREDIGPLNETQISCVDHINQGGKLLLTLINDILSYVKSESGAMPVKLSNFDLHDVVDEAISYSRKKMTEMNVTVQLKTDKYLVVCSDVTRVTQILINLISNAVKYNKPSGEVVIEFYARLDQFHIMVSDTGIGIDPNYHSQMFQAFNRLGAENTSIEGSGIGMSTCKSLAVQMGGELTFSSELKIGSKFVLSLPNHQKTT